MLRYAQVGPCHWRPGNAASLSLTHARARSLARIPLCLLHATFPAQAWSCRPREARLLFQSVSRFLSWCWCWLFALAPPTPDANVFFIETILDAYGLSDAITGIISNPSCWTDKGMFVACAQCTAAALLVPFESRTVHAVCRATPTRAQPAQPCFATWHIWCECVSMGPQVYG